MKKTIVYVIALIVSLSFINDACAQLKVRKINNVTFQEGSSTTYISFENVRSTHFIQWDVPTDFLKKAINKSQQGENDVLVGVIDRINYDNTDLLSLPVRLVGYGKPGNRQYMFYVSYEGIELFRSVFITKKKSDKLLGIRG